MTDLTVPPRPTVHLSFAAFLTPFLELVLICYPGRGYQSLYYRAPAPARLSGGAL